MIFFAAPLASAAMPANTLCPIMKGERVKEKYFVDWNGKRVYLCCRSCVRKFKKHPEKYAEAFAALPQFSE